MSHLTFKKFYCISHQPISMADCGWGVNHVKRLILSCLQNMFFFRFQEVSCRAANPPLPSWVLLWSILIKFPSILMKTKKPRVRFCAGNFATINPLNPELNPICYLLALLGAHHFLHVSRIRVKSLTNRLLMSYIYIYIYIWSTYSWCF